jgi:RNA 3'-terminal phosphate cyclase
VVNGINVEQLQAEIIRQVRMYGNEVQKEINELSKKTAQELIRDLKKTTAFKEKTGDYNKGWRLKKSGKKYIVHNKTDYQLTHLLEHGHAKRGGGRVEAKIHIAPAEDRAISAFLQGIERVIE